MRMSTGEIINLLMKTEYRREVAELAHDFSGAQLLEEAVSINLARSFQRAISTAPGHLHGLIEEYLVRWDIANVMAIQRGITHHVPQQQVRNLLIPAGELNISFLGRLLEQDSCDSVVDALQDWALYPVLAEYHGSCRERGGFARMENELYKQYYAGLLRLAASGNRGRSSLIGYIRFEIDIMNMKNLIRLHCVKERCDIGVVERHLIPGGYLPINQFDRIYGMETEEEFVRAFLQTDIVPVLTQAVRELRQDPNFSSEDAAELIWQRWHQRKGPIHEVEMAVTRVRLRQLEKLSKRYPFSALPIIAYLERKKYEVFNLRAIARGKAFRLPPERIWKYIVL
jgi:V/A-type H+-transporting ATPase subunit C